MVLSICLVALGLVCPGCRPSSTAKLEENKAIARRAFEEIWSQGKLDVIDEIYATGLKQKQQKIVRTSVSRWRAAFPDLKFTIEDQIAEGDKVVTRWTSTGTHKGELMGIAPTGVKMTVTGIEISRIAGGKIMEKGENWDALGMWQQLGVVPPIGEAGKE